MIVSDKQVRQADDLVNAIRSGDEERVQAMVEMGWELNTRSTHGLYPVIEAAKKKKLELVEYLLGCGANPDVKDASGVTLLMCLNGEFEDVAIPKVDMRRVSLVSYAMECGDRNIEKKKHAEDTIKKCLAEDSADVNIQGEHGRTALMWAVIKRNLEIVKCLVEHKADLNLCDKNGHTALHYTFNNSMNERDVEIAKYLIDKGANVNMQDSSGRTLLFNACSMSRTEMVNCLIEHGADVNIPDNKGYTAINVCNHPDVMRSLLKAGAKLDTLSKGTDPFMVRIVTSAPNGHNLNDEYEFNRKCYCQRNDLALEEMDILVKAGADKDVKDSLGRTPLMWAVIMGNLPFVKYLCDAGAAVDVRDNKGKSAAAYAKELGNNGPVKGDEILKCLNARKISAGAAILKQLMAQQQK